MKPLLESGGQVPESANLEGVESLLLRGARRPVPHGGGLEWVLEEHVSHHVSEYAHIKPKRRPLVHCPECGRFCDVEWNPKGAKHLKGAAMTDPDAGVRMVATWAMGFAG
jgi:hypothetical protein